MVVSISGCTQGGIKGFIPPKIAMHCTSKREYKKCDIAVNLAGRVTTVFSLQCLLINIT